MEFVVFLALLVVMGLLVMALAVRRRRRGEAPIQRRAGDHDR